MGGVPVVDAASVPLVGREDETSRLSALLGIRPARLPTAGTSTVVLVDGDAGVGKTRLLSEVTDGARNAGWQVVVGHCLDFGDDALPYLPFTEVVGRLSAELPTVVSRVLDARPALARLQPGDRLLSRPGDPHTAPRASLDRRELFEAVHAVLEAAGERAPTLLIIEDAHWADQSTREILSFLFSRTFLRPVIIAVSYRADDLHRRHPLRAQVAEWSRLAGVERLHLEPLSSGAVRQLLAQLHPASLTEDQITKIIDRADGNPFFVEELVGAADTDKLLPADLADLLLVRLDKLSEGARQVVRAASVAGRRVSHSQLVAVSGLDETSLESALREAVEINVLVSGESAYAFRHALLAEAAYDDLLPGERVRLHARYADALRKGQASGTAAELARHARLALDHETALDASIRAGREAMSVGGPDDAARHFEQALQLLADPQRRPGNISADIHGDIKADIDVDQLVIDTAEALMAGGHPLRADALLADRLTRLPGDTSPAMRARLLANRADAMIMIEPEEDPLAVSAEAVRLLSPEGSSLRAEVLSSHARILSAYGRYEEAQTVGLEALTLAEKLDLRVLASDVITTLSGLKKAGPPDALRTALREAVRRAEASGALQAELRARFLLGRSHDDHAEWDDAERWYRSTLARGTDAHLPWAPSVFDARWELAWLTHLRGRWDETLELTDLTDQNPPVVARQLLDLMRLQVEFARGQDLVELAAMRSSWAVDGLVGIYACGLTIEVAGRNGDPQGAVSTYDEGVAVLSRIWHPAFGARIRLAATAVGAVADNLAETASDDRPAFTDAARRLNAEGHAVLTESQDPSGFWGPEGQAWLRRLDAETLRVRWLTGSDPAPVDELVAAWEETVQRFDALGQPYQTAITRAALADILTASGDGGGAEQQRRLAREVAVGLRAAPLITRLDAHLASGVGSHSGLTPRELEVLELVALGRSNTEIGKHLFITGKTASVHVSNILAKLGAAGRTEAAAIARRQGILP